MNFYVASVATLWTTAMGMHRRAPLTTAATRPIRRRSETHMKTARPAFPSVTSLYEDPKG